MDENYGNHLISKSTESNRVFLQAAAPLCKKKTNKAPLFPNLSTGKGNCDFNLTHLILFSNFQRYEGANHQKLQWQWHPYLFPDHIRLQTKLLLSIPTKAAYAQIISGLLIKLSLLRVNL